MRDVKNMCTKILCSELFWHCFVKVSLSISLSISLHTHTFVHIHSNRCTIMVPSKLSPKLSPNTQHLFTERKYICAQNGFDLRCCFKHAVFIFNDSLRFHTATQFTMIQLSMDLFIFSNNNHWLWNFTNLTTFYMNLHTNESVHQS